MFSNTILTFLLVSIALMDAQPMGRLGFMGRGKMTGYGKMLGHGKMMGKCHGIMNGNCNGIPKDVTCRTFRDQPAAFDLCRAYCKTEQCQLQPLASELCLELKNDFMDLTDEDGMPCDS